ncbi:MAG: SpoIID/LytB domain-containing protein [Elusimicrobia bacterium]|nr:SpoIID/LytB domain-containing protein [Elusimicrobiota bacterium]
MTDFPFPGGAWRTGALFLGLFANAAQTVFAAETEETLRGAYGAFLKGRYEDAASGYRYLETIGAEGAAPAANMALIARDSGKPEEALSLWLKAALLSPKDAFLWNQRGWSYLSMERTREAKEVFQEAFKVSSGPADAAEANFGIGLALELEANLKSAVRSFEIAGVHNPYLAPAAMDRLGRLAARMKRWRPAEIYFKQSLERDPRQPETARRLAAAYEELKSPKAAWLAYKFSLDMDPSDSEAIKRFDTISRYLGERPERLMPARRLARPLLSKPAPPPDSPRLRVALFADGRGEPAHLQRFFFIAGADFKIVDARLGEINRGQGYQQWEISYLPQTQTIEIRDAHQQLQYTTKQAFWIEPVDSGASVLIKTPILNDFKGVDSGDRELRGRIEVAPTPYGFHLINELGREEYLYSILAAAMPAGSPPEAMKAVAVVQRTRLEKSIRPAGEDSFRNDVCDSSHCLVYLGVSGERAEATEAVLKTVGAKLFWGGDLMEAQQHVHCAGTTEEGVRDRPGSGPGIRSVSELELLTHSVPERSFYCETSALSGASWSRWARLLDGAELRARLGKEKDVGRIRRLLVTRRSATGRVEAIELEGPGGKVSVEGASAVSEFLDPGGIRSNLFTLQPIYRGHILHHLIVWGAGSGDGRGLCVAGALGMAHLGKDARSILVHYFPGSDPRGLPALPPQGDEVSGGTPRQGSAATGPDSKRSRSRAREIRERLRRKAKERGAPEN